MAEQVMMEYGEVQKLSDGLGSAGEALQNVVKVMEATITVLKVTAFVGVVGGAALLSWLEQMKPIFEEKAKKLLELQKDVADAIKFIRDGDTSGSSRFR